MLAHTYHDDFGLQGATCVMMKRTTCDDNFKILKGTTTNEILKYWKEPLGAVEVGEKRELLPDTKNIHLLCSGELKKNYAPVRKVAKMETIM